MLQVPGGPTKQNQIPWAFLRIWRMAIKESNLELHTSLCFFAHCLLICEGEQISTKDLVKNNKPEMIETLHKRL